MKLQLTGAMEIPANHFPTGTGLTEFKFRCNQALRSSQNNSEKEPMNKIHKLTFGTLAALIAALCFQTPVMGAANEGDGGVAKITFTKYVTAVLNQPGLIATMTGVGEGDAGDVLFEGEVLQQGTIPPSGRNVVAFYHFTGTKHSFSALIRGLTPVAGIGLKGYVVGIVTSGWLKGHALEGEWLVVPATYAPGTGLGNSFEVTLKIKNGVND